MMETPLVLEDGETLNLVHFVFPLVQMRHLTEWRLACMPLLSPLHSTQDRPFSFMRSDDPRGVTCPQCKRESVFQKAKAELDLMLAQRRPCG